MMAPAVLAECSLADLSSVTVRKILVRHSNAGILCVCKIASQRGWSGVDDWCCSGATIKLQVQWVSLGWLPPIAAGIAHTLSRDSALPWRTPCAPCSCKHLGMHCTQRARAAGPDAGCSGSQQCPGVHSSNTDRLEAAAWHAKCSSRQQRLPQPHPQVHATSGCCYNVQWVDNRRCLSTDYEYSCALQDWRRSLGPAPLSRIR